MKIAEKLLFCGQVVHGPNDSTLFVVADTLGDAVEKLEAYAEKLGGAVISVEVVDGDLLVEDDVVEEKPKHLTVVPDEEKLS